MTVRTVCCQEQVAGVQGTVGNVPRVEVPGSKRSRRSRESVRDWFWRHQLGGAREEVVVAVVVDGRVGWARLGGDDSGAL